MLPQPVEASGEVDRLARHERPDPELPDEPAAVPAGRERRHQDRVAVALPPPGAPERVGLAVHRGVSMLDPPVVPAPEEAATAVEQGRADGDPSLGQAEAGLVNGDLQEGAIVDQVELPIAV